MCPLYNLTSMRSLFGLFVVFCLFSFAFCDEEEDCLNLGYDDYDCRLCKPVGEVTSEFAQTDCERCCVNHPEDVDGVKFFRFGVLHYNPKTIDKYPGVRAFLQQNLQHLVKMRERWNKSIDEPYLVITNHLQQDERIEISHMEQGELFDFIVMGLQANYPER
ncbi:hypothetical protein WA158_002166 [Blastocystis sp. Blastoise]